MSNLMTASNEWRDRPAEERYWNIDALLRAAREQKQSSRESQNLNLKSLTWGDGEEGLHIMSENGNHATLSHYAFGQFSRLLGVPADYMRSLPDYMTAMLMNHAVSTSNRSDVKFLARQNGSSHIVAATSENYSRIWNADIVERVSELATRFSLKNPPGRGIGGLQPSSAMTDTRPATQSDLMACSKIREGDIICPSGLYLSDRDCFMFLVSDRAIEHDGKQYFRGVIISNSEVGDRSAQITKFLFDTVCGNHIIWGAKDVQTTRIVHRGDTAESRFLGSLSHNTPQYLESSTTFETTALNLSHSTLLGENREKTLEVLASRKIGLTETQAKQVVELSETTVDRGSASPYSVWGVTGGITRLSQKQAYSSDRERIDKIGSKVMSFVF